MSGVRISLGVLPHSSIGQSTALRRLRLSVQVRLRRYDPMAEWQGRGLQPLERRFESVSDLRSAGLRMKMPVVRRISGSTARIQECSSGVQSGCLTSSGSGVRIPPLLSARSSTVRASSLYLEGSGFNSRRAYARVPDVQRGLLNLTRRVQLPDGRSAGLWRNRRRSGFLNRRVRVRVPAGRYTRRRDE